MLENKKNIHKFNEDKLSIFKNHIQRKNKNIEKCFRNCKKLN